MRAIGFKNFRKFHDFQDLEFKPITILVGENNAGKSTVVKAIISMAGFMRRMRFEPTNTRKDPFLQQYFYFNSNYFAHIGTFYRALNRQAKDDIIEFSLTQGNYKINVTIKGSSKDKEAVRGEVILIKLLLIDINVLLTFDFEKDQITAHFNNYPSDIISESKLYEDELIKDTKFPFINEIKDHRESVKKYFESIKSEFELSTKISGRYGMTGAPTLRMLLYRFASKFERLFKEEEHSEDPEGKNDNIEGLTPEILTFLKNNRVALKELTEKYGIIYKDFFGGDDIEYIYAHAVNQHVIYSTKDLNDYLVRTIHEYAVANGGKEKKKGNEAYEFVVKWMKELNIGVDFEMTSVGGEAHIVKITEADGYKVNLADKGMGSIQMMILLLRLGTLLKRRSFNKTIIIEEPEQNLHPRIQSKLAELFYEVNKEYKFKFIIETHSEYLVRMIQVIVGNTFKDSSDEEFDQNNPFRVYYFSSQDDPYYDMEITKKGGFKKKFGPGFFNEAGRLDTIVSNNMFGLL